jgi:hypothetical protein
VAAAAAAAHFLGGLNLIQMLLPHNELPVMVGGVGGITPLDIPPIPPLYSQRGPQLQNGARTLNLLRLGGPVVSFLLVGGGIVGNPPV